MSCSLKMGSLAHRLTKYLRLPVSPLVGFNRSFKLQYSTASTQGDDNDVGQNNDDNEDDYDDFLGDKPDLQPQGVDPVRGWGFRGVHKAIICGKVGLAPVQKMLRNNKNVTILKVGTGGMFDQRLVGAKDLPKPGQWHRVVVHNEILGAYAVQKLVKNSCVYIEGDIETRIYNDSFNGEVKSIPEICVRRDGRIRLMKTGESINSRALEDLRNELF